MLVEIPDTNVILSGVTAFLIGLFGLFFYYKLKPYVNFKQKSPDSTYLERLEYYERQLIDMKIRLDALDVSGSDTNSASTEEELRRLVQKLARDPPEEQIVAEPTKEVPQRQEIVPSAGYSDITERVLHLITDKSMTSRDIQITIGRTREHTSRLMKKMFEDGLVQRHTDTKPYSYSMTSKGRERLGLIESAPSVA